MLEDVEDEVFALTVVFERESPFPENKFNSEIVDLGYEIDEGAELEATEMPEEKEFQKDVYQKGCLGVTYIPEPAVLAIRIYVEEMTDLRSSIEELVDMLSEELKIDIDADVERFQTSFRGNVWEGEPTSQYFVNKYKPDFSGIFDEECNPFSFRLVSGFESQELPQYDIRIEPYARNTDYFFITTTVSHDNLEDSLSFTSNIETKLEQLIEVTKDG